MKKFINLFFICIMFFVVFFSLCCSDNNDDKRNEENKEFSAKLAAAATYMTEMQQKFILGGADPEKDFDEYIRKTGELGMNDVIELCQKKYDEYMK